MTEPFKRVGHITTFTYDIKELQNDARHTTVSIYEKAGLKLPVTERTSMVYEDDGHGSAVLREIIRPSGQVETVPHPRSNTHPRCVTTIYDEDGRMIARRETS